MGVDVFDRLAQGLAQAVPTLPQRATARAAPLWADLGLLVLERNATSYPMTRMARTAHISKLRRTIRRRHAVCRLREHRKPTSQVTRHQHGLSGDSVGKGCARHHPGVAGRRTIVPCGGGRSTAPRHHVVDVTAELVGVFVARRWGAALAEGSEFRGVAQCASDSPMGCPTSRRAEDCMALWWVLRESAAGSQAHPLSRACLGTSSLRACDSLHSSVG